MFIISQCGFESNVANGKVKNFIESKRLTSNEDKCTKFHIGSKEINCPKLTVTDSEIKKSFSNEISRWRFDKWPKVCRKCEDEKERQKENQ